MAMNSGAHLKAVFGPLEIRVLQALWSRLHESGDDIALHELVARHAAVDPSLSTRPDPARVGQYRTRYARFLQHLEAVRTLHAA